MPSVLELRGAEQYRTLARLLKEAGDKGLNRELNKGIAKSVVPARREIRAEMRRSLPAAGGLNVYVAKSSLRVKKRRVGRNAGVSIVASKRRSDGKKVDLRAMNRGRLRHMLFGNRHHWYPQTVTPGFWERGLQKTVDRSSKEMQAAMDAVAQKIVNRANFKS